MQWDVSPRRSRSLDGEWMFDVDPDGVGMREGWGTEPATWVTEANPVDVPHVWQEDDDLRGYTGTAWYHRPFNLEAPVSSKVFLEFGAVDYWATVWVNGERLGDHRGGYLPFEFEVTSTVVTGENTVTVAVHDPEDVSEIPHGKQGNPWYTRVSGIWQSVSLSVRPESHVTDVKVTPDLEADAARVTFDLDIGGHDRESLQAIVQASRKGSIAALEVVDIREGTEVVLEFENVDYWSPESPALYDIEIILRADGEAVDRYVDTFGMRSLKHDGEGGFLLNGKPIRLRGILDQGYYPETLYRPPEADTFEREVAAIKDLGFNLVRKHLKPAHPDFLEVANREGLLVWEEPANPTRYTNRSREAVTEELHALIDRDYNRPSVVIWSIYNEEWGIGHHSSEEPLWTDETKQAALASTVEGVRERDPTRLVCDNSGWAHVATDINDYHRYVLSPDRATEWTGALEHMLHHRGDNYATRRWTEPDAPVVVSEFGMWALPDLEALVDHYGRRPPWFAHEFLTEPMKRPSDVEKRFEQTGISDVFGSLDSLAESWRRRAIVCLEHVVGEFRKREAVAGYVMTQLSDVEWEVNGILDHRREPKSEAFSDRIAAMNADVALVTTLGSHVAWGGGICRLEIALVNDTGERVKRNLEWTFGETSGTLQLTVPPYSVAESEPINLPIPWIEEPRIEQVVVREEDLVRKEPVTVVPASLPAPRGLVVFAKGEFASKLSGVGITVTHRLGEDVDIAFVTAVTSQVREFIERGGVAVQMPLEGGEMAENGPFEFRELARTDSWNSTASFFYQDSPLLSGLCAEPRLGWEFEDAYPYEVVSELDQKRDVVHVGHVWGWLADWGSPLVERPIGDGRLVACSFRVRDVGSHPVVTALVFRLIDHLADN